MSSRMMLHINFRQVQNGRSSVRTLMTAALMIGLAACADGPQPAKNPQTAAAPALSDAHGMTLYL
jgi:predicted lipoprotein with Yx(FWY)xxD motif